MKNRDILRHRFLCEIAQLDIDYQSLVDLLYLIKEHDSTYCKFTHLEKKRDVSLVNSCCPLQAINALLQTLLSFGQDES